MKLFPSFEKFSAGMYVSGTLFMQDGSAEKY